MTGWTVAIYAVVLLWLMPGAIYRPVALSLLCCWAVCEGYYAATGIHVPRDLYYACDAVILLTVAVRRVHWSELLVVPLIVAQWRYYPDATRHAWLMLYYMTMLQFIICGGWPAIQKMRGPKLAFAASLRDLKEAS